MDSTEPVLVASEGCGVEPWKLHPACRHHTAGVKSIVPAIAIREGSLARLQRSMELALNHETPRIATVRINMNDLERKPIPQNEETPPMAVATVAADGGENHLHLEPIRIQVLRVADSNGVVYFEEFIPLSLDPQEIIRFFVASNDLAQWFLSELQVTWQELMPRDEYQKSVLMATLRELMEWASVMKLMASSPRSPVLVIRDGLLRSITLNRTLFAALKDRLRRYSNETGNYLVGVAKRSAVLNYLSLAIALDGVLPVGDAAYVAIPSELEREATPASYRWASPRSMGQLLLARLCPSGNLVLPVEIPHWYEASTPAIMQSLSRDALASFPNPGYPLSLVRAHSQATIGGMDMRIIEGLFYSEIRRRDPVLAREAAMQALLGKRLTQRTGDEEDG